MKPDRWPSATFLLPGPILLALAAVEKTRATASYDYKPGEFLVIDGGKSPSRHASSAAAITCRRSPMSFRYPRGSIGIALETAPSCWFPTVRCLMAPCSAIPSRVSSSSVPKADSRRTNRTMRNVAASFSDSSAQRYCARRRLRWRRSRRLRHATAKRKRLDVRRRNNDDGKVASRTDPSCRTRLPTRPLRSSRPPPRLRSGLRPIWCASCCVPITRACSSYSSPWLSKLR